MNTGEVPRGRPKVLREVEELEAVLQRVASQGWSELGIVVRSKHWGRLSRRGWDPGRCFVTPLDPERVQALVEHGQSLERLAIIGCGLKDAEVTPLTSLTGLTRLDLSRNEIGPEGAKAIGWLGGLTSLSLRGNPIGDEGAKAVAALSGLVDLDVEKCEVGPEGAVELSRLSHLHRLVLSQNGVGDVGASALAKLSGLRELELSVGRLSDEGALAIAKLRGLELLELGGNDIGDEGAKALGGLSNLRRLSLSVNQLGGEAGGSLAPLLRTIQSLDLSYNKLGDRGLELLLEALVAQDFRGFQHLDLIDNGVTLVQPSVLRTRKPLEIVQAFWQGRTRQGEGQGQGASLGIEDRAGAIIEEALAGWSSDRERTRGIAAEGARDLIEDNLRAFGESRLSREDVIALLDLFNQDSRDGKALRNRFAPAFVGSTADMMLDDLGTLNHWVERLWRARTDREVAEVLDGFWSTGNLRGAGRSFPTMVLHVREPDRYWPMMSGLSEGFTELTGQGVGRRTGESYLSYTRGIRALRENYVIPAHAVDLVLAVARSVGAAEAKAASSGIEEEELGTSEEREDPPDAPSASLSVSGERELHLQLRLGKDGCQVRLIGAPWPGRGSSIPSTDDFLKPELSSAELDYLGRELFEALVAEPAVRVAYDAVVGESTEPVRVILEQCDDEGHPGRCSIADACWEAVVDPKLGSLGTHARIRLCRRREGMALRSGLVPTKAQARVFVGFAAPLDKPELKLLDEWGVLNGLDTNTLLDMRFERATTVANLSDHLEGVDVFHFAGHGEVGALVLEKADRASQRLDAKALGGAFPSPVPRLAVINACEGSVATAQVASVAELLLRAGVAAVVAMNGAFPDDTAVLFSEELYRRLAVGMPVDEAVQRARWRVFAEGRRGWFLVTLWLHGAGFPLLLADAQTQAKANSVRAALNDRELRLQRVVAVVHGAEHGARVRELSGPELRELSQSLVVEAEQRGSRAVQDPVVVARAVARARRSSALSSGGRELEGVGELVSSFGNVAGALPDLLRTLEGLAAAQMTQAAQMRQAAPGVASVSTEAPWAEAPPAREALPTYADHTDRALSLPRARSLAAVERTATGQLSLPAGVVTRCLRHLLAGRHLVLTGPPGTGKSTLAAQLAQAFGYGLSTATANPDWTTYDTIGGLAPTTGARGEVAYVVEPGCVLRAVDANWAAREGDPEGPRARPESGGTWLLIDEMNRAPLDQAFGDLFTALVDRKLHDPRTQGKVPIPQDFRLICTANTADRRLLFEFSEALKRRFAFVEVPAFEGDGSLGADTRALLLAQLRARPVIQALSGMDVEASFAALADRVSPIVQRVRWLHPLGLAQVLEVFVYVLVAEHYGGSQAPEDALGEALVDNWSPALESQPRVALEGLCAVLSGPAQPWFERVRRRSEESYQIDAVCERVADDLWRGLGGGGDWRDALSASPGAEADPDAFAGADPALVEGPGDALVQDTASFVERLEQLVAERAG